MSTLSTTLTLSSTDMFPGNFSIKKTLTENISGLHDEFSSISIPGSSNVTLFSSSIVSGNSGVLYLYLESPSTNTGNVNIQIGYSQNVALFARVMPGDFVYLPVWSNNMDGIVLTAYNEGSSAVTVNYFVGERG